MAREAVQVFVPAHVTGFFSVHRRDELGETGSRGAGITLSDGVTVSIEPAEDSRVEVDGHQTTVPAVETVLADFEGEFRVSCNPDVPLGSGFGASGAMALATAVGLNQIVDRSRTEDNLAAIAHAADIQAGTGLGDVVAQLRGGVPVRTVPGGPGYGTVDAIPASGRIEYLSLGSLSTQSVIAGETEQLNAAGALALSRLLEDPSLPTLMAESRQFSRDAGLLPAEIDEVIADVVAVNGEAAMAMIGRTVFALGTGLTDAGYEPSVCEIDHGGVRYI